MHIRPLDPSDAAEVDLVTQRMRLTLVDVLGAERGEQMYSLDWLRRRLLSHVDGTHTGAVLVARDGALLGHTILRVEEEIGWFSTTYVEPAARRRGVARALVRAGEAWLLRHPVRTLATNTGAHNTPLIRLFEGLGYSVTVAEGEMVRLTRPAQGKIAP